MIVGVVGQGFVGSAIREGLKNFYEVLTYDLDETKCNSTQETLCREADIIFVCLPTPMRVSGECDTRILEGAVNNLDNICKKEGTSPIIVLKSTIPP